MEVEIISRADARSRGLKVYFTGRPCRHGHVAQRDVCDKKCRACKKNNVKALHASGYYKNWRGNNPDYMNRYLECPENAVRMRASCKRSHERNPNRLAQRDVRRRVGADGVAPIWADRDAIAAIYREARQRTIETGIRHEVDHIIPLRGENVCGLHVHNNLQVISASENRRKRNKIPEFLLDSRPAPEAGFSLEKP